MHVSSIAIDIDGIHILDVLRTRPLNDIRRSKSIILYPNQHSKYPVALFGDGPWPEESLFRGTLTEYGVWDQVEISVERDFSKAIGWLCKTTVLYNHHEQPNWRDFLSESLINNLLLPDKKTILEALRTTT